MNGNLKVYIYDPNKLDQNSFLYYDFTSDKDLNNRKWQTVEKPISEWSGKKGRLVFRLEKSDNSVGPSVQVFIDDVIFWGNE